MIGVDLDSAEIGIMTAGADVSSVAIVGSTGMAVSTEIVGASMAAMAGATNFSAFQISSSGTAGKQDCQPFLLFEVVFRKQGRSS